jgi:hypothetical protein
MYYNTGDNTFYWWNGTAWRSADASSGVGGPPTGAAGGDLLGSTYPNPIIAASVVTLAKCNASMNDQAAGTASLRSLGTTAITACAGNDSRLSDGRAPTGAAGGDLSGSTYPNPVVAALAITDAKVATANKDGAVGTFCMRTLAFGAGTGQKAMPGDARFDLIATNNAPTAPVPFNAQRITGVGDPLAAQDAATKNYVDTFAQGLDSHPSCRVATVGANITLVGGAPQILDGVTLVANDRVLVKDQTLQKDNGIYYVQSAGTGATGTWVRALDQDTWAEFPSAYVWVETGTINQDTGWTCTSDQGGTLGSTAILWTQFSSAGSAIAGTGMTKTGNTLDVIGTANRITANADNIDIASNYAGQSTITTLGTIAGVSAVWGPTATPIAIASGGTGSTAATAARAALGVVSWYSSAVHGTGSTISISAATHGMTNSGIFVIVQVNATGAYIMPDIAVDGSGNVTVNFGVSQTANTIRVTLLGLTTSTLPT